MEKRTINPWSWQDAFAFSHAIEVSGASRVLYCSGQPSIDDTGGAAHAGDMRAQVGQALDNLETVLKKAGFALTDVVRLNYYTTDVASFLGAYDVVVSRLTDAGCQPSSTLLGIQSLAFPELMIEIEATAAR